ncbi:cyclopropane-fatty-acyl-phospholipid synthase family protein [Candidatus Accumulibacter sp. ACC003]|uniref:SAM-dependent methyltransferase n=1 Tax=Candidatus Accumulibacter sp. ACC003 TaxID=2823334 RepID=UPI0025C5E52A|nr:cyclopropane-fatty-acyl-phospholipid synthase family protein [Candidatus Accumulibacter sp. ACC003]
MNASENTLTFPAAIAAKRMPRSARAVLALLDKIAHGALEVRLPDGDRLRFGQLADGDVGALLEIASWSAFDRVIERGDVGFAEAWIDGHWHSPDLTALLTLLANNRQSLSQAVYGHWWGLLSARLRHLLNANTRAGARRNIIAHYDLGNDFYRLWLDPTMSYSSALYSSDAPRSMAAAQLAKYRRIIKQLDARRGQRVLEIGCGWGAFAETAAREAGLHVVGLTLSPAQHQFAGQRMRLAGVEQQVQIELRDYRELLGEGSERGERFDHIVSIEMFEAVGERWWPTYFATLQRLLAPGGRAVVQSITIRDDLFARYRRGTDFIQQHVFPGGMLPSPSVFGKRAARAGLDVRDSFAFGRDYARTLAEWSVNFEQQWPAIAAQGFDERFRRLWRFYLAYCQAGFNSGATDVMQFELAHAR